MVAIAARSAYATGLFLSGDVGTILSFVSIIRAFLVEEQKIVKKIAKEAAKKEAAKKD